MVHLWSSSLSSHLSYSLLLCLFKYFKKNIRHVCTHTHTNNTESLYPPSSKGSPLTCPQRMVQSQEPLAQSVSHASGKKTLWLLLQPRRVHTLGTWMWGAEGMCHVRDSDVCQGHPNCRVTTRQSVCPSRPSVSSWLVLVHTHQCCVTIWSSRHS